MEKLSKQCLIVKSVSQSDNSGNFKFQIQRKLGFVNAEMMRICIGPEAVGSNLQIESVPGIRYVLAPVVPVKLNVFTFRRIKAYNQAAVEGSKAKVGNGNSCRQNPALAGVNQDKP